MKPIQMVDLQGQYEAIKDEIDAGIAQVIRSAKFINGPEVGLFENELADYLQVKHVIGCANGTDALQIALMALNLPKDAEIIVPSFNYVAAAEVVALLGYKLFCPMCTRAILPLIRRMSESGSRQKPGAL